MRKVAAWILAVGLLLFGVLSVLNGIDSRIASKVEIDHATWFSYTDIEKDEVYLITKLTVISDYARLDGDSVVYLLVTYDDLNGKPVAASMAINMRSPVWSKVDKYLRDDTKGPGDLVLSCYVKAEKFQNVQGELEDMFASGIRNANRTLGVTLKRLEYSLDYVCSSREDPTEIINATSLVGIIAGGVAIVVALVLILFVGLRKSKPKAKKAAPAPVQYQRPVPPNAQMPYQHPVQQGAPVQFQRPVPVPPNVPGQRPVPMPPNAPMQWPVPAPQAAPAPQPAPEPHLEPISQPIPVLRSEPVPQPVLEPQVEPAPQTVLEHQGEPVPQPGLEHQGEPVPQPVLEPQVEPVPQPIPMPQSAPMQQPVAAPRPVPQSFDNIRQQLDQLKKLQQAGYLSEEEFDKKRRELLGL